MRAEQEDQRKYQPREKNFLESRQKSGGSGNISN
jgi:hypothetical protein